MFRDDSSIGRLREQVAAAEKQASDAYAAFTNLREATIEKHGAEAIAKDAKLLEPVQAKLKEHKAASAKADELRTELIGALEKKVRGDDLSKGIPGLGEAFVAKVAKALDGTSGGSMVPPFFDPRIRELPQRQLFVRSVIPVRPADGDKVWYLRQSVATQSAAPVAAGAVKPTSVYTVERIEETVRTIAHVTEALDRALLSDETDLIEFLNNQLRLGVLQAEDNQILNGNGTAPNLRGILNTAGIFAQPRGADSNMDAIFKAMQLVRSAFMEPTAIVVNPGNWQSIRLVKDTNGLYLVGPPGEDGVERLFGKPVIQTPAIALNTGLVGAFDVGCTVWDREEARVTFTESGLGDGAGTELFTRNQVRFRGEERIAFGVERPQAFSTVTGLN